MDTLDTKKEQQKKQKIKCIFCNVLCSSKYNYNRHTLTPKHQNCSFGYILDTKKEQKEQKEQIIQTKKFVCDCGKIYKHSQGLSKHKKSCNNISTEIIKKDKNEIEMLTNLVMNVMQQNQDLTDKIIDISKSIQNNVSTNIINNNNSNNKTFNLNLFLNETCKDAMNIMDFVDSIKLQLSDLENVGKLGYIEGISNIITSNLNALDITQRPVHCTDKKREVLYIKDENKWEKDEERNKLRNVIKQVVSKNQRVLPQFKEKYPDCNTSISKFSDQYNKIIIEAMGGYGENDLEKEDKIIKNIAKNVIIDK